MDQHSVSSPSPISLSPSRSSSIDAFQEKHLEKRKTWEGRKVIALVIAAAIVTGMSALVLLGVYVLAKRINHYIIDHGLLRSRSKYKTIEGKKELTEQKAAIITDNLVYNRSKNPFAAKLIFLRDEPLRAKPDKSFNFITLSSPTEEDILNFREEFPRVFNLKGAMKMFLNERIDRVIEKMKENYIKNIEDHIKNIGEDAFGISLSDREKWKEELEKIKKEKDPIQALLHRDIFEDNGIREVDLIKKAYQDAFQDFVDREFSISKEFAEEVSFTTHDRVKLNGFEIRHSSQINMPANQQKWMVCFMAKDDLYENALPRLQNMSEAIGCNILTFNYRGVGESQDTSRKSFLSPHLIEEDLIADGQAAVDFLVKKGVQLDHILLHGHSQGGAVATQVANLYQQEDTGVHLCIDRSFSSYKNALKGVLGRVIGTIGAWIASATWEFNSLKTLQQKNLKGHLIVVEHPNDEIISESARLGRHISSLTSFKKVNYIQMKSFTEDDKAKIRSRPEFTNRSSWPLSPEGISAHNMSLISFPFETRTEKEKEFIGAAQEALKIKRVSAPLLKSGD